MMVSYFFYGALALLGWLICFQCALAAGLPIGKLAWGGQHRVLPSSLRWASLAVFVYLVVVTAALYQIMLGDLARFQLVFARSFVWTAVAVMGFSVVGNSLTQSRLERMIGVPVSAALLVCLVGVLLLS